MESRSGRRRLRSSLQIAGAPMEVRPGRRLRSAQPQLCSPRGGGGEPDHISFLPQELLLLILTLMGCAATAARTSVLSRRWRDLWTHLRQISFNNLAPSIAAALGRVRGPPAAAVVSLLEVRIPSSIRHPGPVGATATRLLRAAVRLEPEEIVLSFPWGVEFQDRRNLVRLSCFQRTKSLMMERLLFYCPDGEFTALRTLSISYGLGGLHSLLPRCPHLLVLSLKFVNDGFGLVQNGSISLHLPLLQELFLESSIMYADAVDIVAPLLKRLTVSFGTYKLVSSFSVSAPMLEKVSWHSWYLGDGSIVRFGRWSLQKLCLHTGNTQGQLPSSLHISASASNSSWFTSNEDNFAQEIEKHLVADFSLLELRLLKAGHVFGALVFHLLGITRISRGIQRLKIVLERSRLKGKCSSNCSCQPTNWRSQTISLTALEEVEINGFEGQEHEFDLLKLILKCAPVLKKMILQRSPEASSNNSGSTKIYDICNTYSSVEFYVYESSRLMHGGLIYPLT
ncbi:hypothetical protein CFC21_105554 [Triticum aestivum]|uniref:FBD domain-containing protein n=3 Tax=Triticum TaxID=4564 RepID=A0A9R1AEK9_TRITD|nr:F-box/LRR-repeat protein At2g42730-like [Triticum aestivum]KAF7104674.1 hypothetical protein CFC21_105554 [Triticum aestivum]VAI93313.1 unnamed protein product [Triticum turgidum subsp. durum]